MKGTRWILFAAFFLVVVLGGLGVVGGASTDDSMDESVLMETSPALQAGDSTPTVLAGDFTSTERESVLLAEDGLDDPDVEDGDSIRAAINDAESGDEIVVGDGTYEESLEINKPLTLRAVSEGEVVLDGGDSLEGAMTVTADDVTVEGFRIEGYAGGSNAAAVSVVEGDRFTILNTTIVDNDAVGIDLNRFNDNFEIDGNELRRNDAGIVDAGTGNDDGTIANNTLTDNRDHGINLDSSGTVIENNDLSSNNIETGNNAKIRYNNISDIAEVAIKAGTFATVADNTIEDVGSVGIEPQVGTEIKYNTLSDVPIGISSERDNLQIHENKFANTETDLRLDNALEATVTDNQFATGIVLVDVPETLDEEPHQMSGNTVGGDPLVYAVGEDDPTIDLHAGQVILVDVTNANLDGFSVSDVTAGIQVTHSEQISITDSEFTDIGESSPIVSADVAGAVSTWYSSGVTIDEFALTTSDRGILVTDSDDVTVSNGTISASADQAIRVDGTNDGVAIEYNTITGEYNDGIRIDVVEDLSIVGNEVTEADRGITILSATDAVVTDNIIDETSTGVQFGRDIGAGPTDIQNLTFTNNTITGGSDDGVAMPSGSITDGATVTENIITGNDGVGLDVDIDEDGATVASNTVMNNGIGMDLTRRSGTPVQNLDVTENRIEANEGDGLRLDGETNVLVEDNSITGNDIGLEYSGDGELDARNNWWGASSGPSGDVTDPETGDTAEGDGDAVSESVRFAPWLESSPIADMAFLVEIDSVDSPVIAGEDITVTVTVENTGPEEQTQTISLEDLDGDISEKAVTLEQYEEKTVTFTIETEEGDAAYGDVIVRSDDDSDIAEVAIQQEDEITGCRVIDTPGVYTKTGGQSSSTTCLEITSSYVEVVGTGPSIVGQSPVSNQYGIHVNGADGQLTNVVVRDLHLTGWTTGGVDKGAIYLENVTDSELSGLSTANSYWGIWGEDVSDSTFDDNDFTGMTWYGMYLSNSSGNTISGTDISEPYYGLILDAGSNDNYLVGNDISANNYGISILGSTDNELVDTTARYNRGDARAPTDLGDFFSDSGAASQEDAVTTVSELTLSTLSETDSTWNDADLLSDGTAFASDTLEAEFTIEPQPDILVSFESKNADLQATTAPVANADAESLSQYIDVGMRSADAYLDLAVHYDPDTLGDADETELSLWMYDGGWTELADSSVDTDAEVVTATLTSDGIVGVFAQRPDGNGEAPSLPVTEDVSGLTLVATHEETEEQHEFDVTYNEGTTWNTTIDTNTLQTGEYALQKTIENVYGSEYSVAIEETLEVTAEPIPTAELSIEDFADQLPESGDEEFGQIDLTVEETMGAETQNLEVTLEVREASDPVAAFTETISDRELSRQSDLFSFDVGTLEMEESYSVVATADADNAVRVSRTYGDKPADWSQFRGDTNRTGSTTATGPLTDVGKAWSYSTSEPVRSSPAVVNGVVYAGSDDGYLYAVDMFTGEKQWSYDAGGPITSSPTVADGVVYVGVKEDDGNNVIAVDAVDGTEVWGVEISNYAGVDFSSPAIDGDTLYIGTDRFMQDNLWALDIDDGSVRWSEEIEGSSVLSSPLVNDGNIYVKSTHVSDNMWSVDAQSGSPNWDINAGNTRATPTIVDGTLYVGGFSDVRALDPETGDELWSFDVDGRVTASPAVADGIVYVATDPSLSGANGSVYAVDADPEWTEGSYEDEDELWHFEAEDGITSSPAVANGIVYVGSNDGHVYALDTDGTELWSFETGDSVVSSPAVVDGMLYVGSNDGNLYALADDLADGPSEPSVSVVINETNSVTDVTDGETLSVVADITNDGENPTEYIVVLSIAADTVTPMSEPSEESGRLFVSEPQDVTIGSDETETVTFTVESDLEFDGADARVDAVVAEDTDIQDFDTISVAVTAEDSEPSPQPTPDPGPDPEPELDILDATVTPTQLQVGEQATIEATVENVGDGDGELTVPLSVNGETVETTTVTLDSGETTDLTFTHTFENAGAFQLSVDGVTAGEVTVMEAEPADIVIYGAEVSQSSLLLGETITITGDLFNNGGTGTFDVDLNVDGDVVDSTTVEVGPGATPGGVEFEWTPTEADLPADADEMNATITLNGFVVDTVHVENQYSDIQVIAASASDIELVEGEEMYVVGSIYQAGNIEGTEEIELTATNTETDETSVVGTQEVTLDAGFYHLGALNISYTPEEAGTYDLELGDRNAGTIEVETAESDIQVIAASNSELELVEGEQAYVVGSIYQAGNIEGTEEIELTATNTDTDETEILGSQEVTLSPGFYHLGALNISYTPDEAGTYDLELGDRNAGTIEVEAAESDIQVIAASSSEIELVEGEQAYVVGSIHQAGNIEGTEEIELTATNTDTGETEILGSQEVTLSPGFYHLGALNISYTPDEAGTYDLALGDRNAGTVEVEAAESDIQVIAASNSELELVEGEQAYVVGSIHQAGNIEGTEEIELTATNTETNETEVLGTQEVTLSPGFYHLGALNISYTPEEAGTYDIELGDRNAGTVEVEAAESDIQVIAASVGDIEILQTQETYVVGSIYQAGNIDGPQEISLNATHQETGETHTVDTVEVELSPGFYHLGALNVTFEPDEAGTYDLALGDRNAGFVEVEPAEPDIEVIEASASDVEVIEGENFSVVGSIYNSGDVEGTEEIELTATSNETGETHVLGSQEVTLGAGFYHLGAINISAEFNEPGYYDLQLGTRDAGLIAVEEAITDITVIAASTGDTELVEGEETYTVGSIYQGGNVEETEEISLTATHVETNETTVVGSQNVTLAPQFYHLGALNITFQPDQAGTYELELGDRNAGTVDVAAAESDIEVIAAGLSEVELVAGEETYVTGSIYQNGTIDGPQEIALNATNQETGETQTVETVETELSPGFYHLGALNVTFGLDQPGTYDLALGDRNAGTIEVEAAESDIQVIAASSSEIELVEGEQAYVVGSIHQAGNIEGTEEIELTATNTDTGETEILGSQEVTLSPGFYHLGAINISYTPEEAGTYDLELGDRNAGTIEVEPAESDIQVIAASNSELELVEGEQAYVVGSIHQAGNIEGTEEIELTATNTETNETEVLGTQEVTLSPGFYHLGALNISYSPEEAGTYDLELGDRNAGTIEVEAAESDIQVIAASNSRVEMVAGEESYVVGSIHQAGNIEGTEEIELTATNTDTGESEVVGSQEVTLSPGFYHLGAINISYSPGQAGTYDLELGDRNAGTVAVDEPTVELSAVEVDGYSEAFDPDTETEQVYASDEASVSVDIDADLTLETVNVLVSSLETNYVRAFEASHESGSTWTTTVPLADIQDDGRYEVSVIAVDEVGTAGTATAERPLVINRDSPRLSATLEDVDGESATVVVESNEPLVDPPEVEGVFTAPDNSTESDSVAMLAVGGSDTHFTGSFATGETGTYEITSIGTDRAGNEGTDTASATVDTRFTLGDGIIELADTGTAIEFDVIDDADEALLAQDLFLSLSETTANANLDDGDLGVNFITADLDNLLDYYLDEGTVESASISMAIDEATLPAGASADEVELQYYDDASGNWDPVADSTVTQIDNDPFVTASVTSFSTYGAFVPDTEPPEIVDRSPAADSTLDSATEETTVRFEYVDNRSGVNTSSVTLEINGEDVTASDETTITSTQAEHVLQVESGTSYVANISIADAAGNVATANTSFDVAEEAEPPSDSEPSEDSDAEPADDSPEESAVTADDDGPGFGIIGALAALAGVGYLINRRV